MSTSTKNDVRAQIQEPRHRFGRALDQRDWDLFGSLFTDEVEADFSAFGIPAARLPRARIIDVMKHSFRRGEMKSHQVYSNFEIEVGGDGATALSSESHEPGSLHGGRSPREDWKKKGVL